MSGRMTNVELKLLKSFTGGFINDNGEFIPERSGVACFNISNCKFDEEIKCKVLEWCSKAAFKSEPYQSKKRNNQLHEFMLNGINMFLDTDFSEEDMELIYAKLGNGCNRPLCEKFVMSGYDMEVLK
ncbi:hypothetical protein [Blautia argi]|jgi:hypothetical protein|uniref:hypothetical protein n=1 Tax=Blautia argi TaxID=1912897 RepID=UPI0029429187|nr:hypothetical protein [Blautia argi]